MATQLLTEDQIKQAAYKLCETAGMDPEQPVQASSPTSEVAGFPVVLTVLVTQPLWQSVAAQIAEADRIQHAIQFARGITGGDTIN